MGISLQVFGLKETRAKFASASSKFDNVVVTMLERGVKIVENETKRLARGKLIKVRSGGYIRHIRSTVDRARFMGVVGTNYGPAPQIEFGGTITPKQSKYLAIPLKAARTKAGVGKSPSQFPGAFVVKSRKGNLLIVRKKGKKNIQPLFVLKKSVKQDPKLVFQTAWENTAGEVGNSAQREMEKLINEVF